MIRILRKFFKFCGKENSHKFYLGLLGGVFLAIFEVLRIPAIMVLLKGAFEDNLTSTMILLSFGFILTSVIGSSLAKYRITMLQCNGGHTTCATKRMAIAEHIRFLPMGFFNKNSLGQITSVATNTMDILADNATLIVMLTTQALINTFIIAIALLFYAWQVGLVVVIGVIVFFAINSFLQKKSQEIAPRKVIADSNLVEKLLSYIRGIGEIKAYNITGDTSKSLNQAIETNRDTNIEMEMKFLPLMGLQNYIIKLTGVVMALLSIWLLIQNNMDLLTCSGMLICSFMVYSNLESAGSYTSLLIVIDENITRVNHILETEEMDIEGEEITPKNHNISIHNIDFSYDKRKIIVNLSVDIPEKTTTAIVGPSGGGKTTFCHLIARFFDVNKGEILLGGTNIKQYSMNSLMNNFSFVFQDVYLFHDTIANNIRFGEPQASMKRVIDAAKKACCHDFIMQLPDKYETVIGEGGGSLSGGERQRISIARAIMKDAPIIILDEATANVDPENEKELMMAIDSLTKEKTILMIAHRLKTVQNADQILVIDHGKIVQKGNHKQLMSQDGIYRRFIDCRKLAVGWKLTSNEN